MRNIIRDFIRNFVLENFLLTHNPRALRNDASLAQMGFLDATGAFELTTFLADTFGVHIAEDALFLANLDTVDGLVAFVERAISQRASRPAWHLASRRDYVAAPICARNA